jgi:hypothetical protein
MVTGLRAVLTVDKQYSGRKATLDQHPQALTVNEVGYPR